MFRNKKSILLGIILISSISLFGQYNANSPYSRYGLGELNQNGFAQNSSMGGLAIGLREPNQINIQNPASLTAQDTMSFIWDIGLMSKISKTSSSNASNIKSNFNFDHLAVSFSVTKKYYVSIGLLPYSTKGYSIAYTSPTTNAGNVNYTFKGSGNLNQIFFGNAIGLLKKKVNIGLNLSYIFGELNLENSYTPINSAKGALADSSVITNFNQNNIVNGLSFNVGIQGDFILSPSVRMIGGAIFTPGANLKSDFKSNVIREYPIASSIYTNKDTLISDTINSTYKIPLKFGIGASFIFKEKLIIGIDYSTQDWSKAIFNNTLDNSSLKSDNRISIGLQYTPNSESFRSYFDRIRYRAGAFYNDTYIKASGTPIKDYGFSVGFGIPLRNGKSMFNIGSEFGRRGTTDNNLVQIDYSRITFSLILYDNWFFKRKYD